MELKNFFGSLNTRESNLFKWNFVCLSNVVCSPWFQKQGSEFCIRRGHISLTLEQCSKQQFFHQEPTRRFSGRPETCAPKLSGLTETGNRDTVVVYKSFRCWFFSGSFLGSLQTFWWKNHQNRL